MSEVGVIEGFFGPAWPMAARLDYAEFIQRTGGGFYIYAPKQDQHLRKTWREPWPQDWLNQLSEMARHFHSAQVVFGVGLSPFGLGKELSDSDQAILKQKLQQLSSHGVELLGLFFDDMPVNDDLAPAQMSCLAWVRQHFSGKIVFCPSFYSYDPILEKVFGKMPEGYWPAIASGTPADVALAWTGPKVISPEIPSEHLEEVTELLKRRPYLWENLFANDGPKNCKFLKLRPFTGRDGDVLKQVDGYGFNMMNQPYLSQIVFLGSRLVLEKNLAADQAFGQALRELCPADLAAFIQQHRQAFLEKGLDQLENKAALILELSSIGHPVASEIIGWLRGDYVVGSECLTD